MKTSPLSVTANPTKLLHHLEALQAIQRGQPCPPMVCISPTNRCNLSCPHCCFAGREMSDEMPLELLAEFLRQIGTLGMGALELAGGGEPMMYPQFPELVALCADRFAMGLCTNGTLLSRLSDYSPFTWVRVSLNAIERIDRDGLARAEMQTDVSACFVATWGNMDQLPSVYAFAEEEGLTTRVAPDCIQAPDRIDALLDALRERMGPSELVFLSDFNTNTKPRSSQTCYMHMLKPFLGADGWLYTCPSAELAVEYGRDNPKSHRLCRADDVLRYYLNECGPVVRECSFCKYTDYNEIVNAACRDICHHNFL